MWTRGKSKTQDHLVEFEGVYAKYNKIILIINSCTTRSQLESNKQIVKNFQTWCVNFKVNPKIYFTLIKFLNEKIENKFSRIS